MAKWKITLEKYNDSVTIGLQGKLISLTIGEKKGSRIGVVTPKEARLIAYALLSRAEIMSAP